MSTLSFPPRYKHSLQVLSEEIEKATTSAEYLSQKRAWGEDRLGVARLMALFSPAGHSLLSWAAACGQTGVVEILMNHGATADLGDETRAVSASIIQVGGYRCAVMWCFGCFPQAKVMFRMACLYFTVCLEYLFLSKCASLAVVITERKCLTW